MDLFPFYDRTIVSDGVRSSAMDKMNKSDPAGSRDAVVDPDKRKREYEGGGEEKKDEAGDHFESLKRAVDLINTDLERKNSRYRFYIYREHDEVFIHLVRLDGQGEMVEIKKKNITHQEFTDILNHLENGEGLLVDKAG
jgi:hypothetical protein